MPGGRRGRGSQLGPPPSPVMDEIARTSVGKINKKKLRAEYEDAYTEGS